MGPAQQIKRTAPVWEQVNRGTVSMLARWQFWCLPCLAAGVALAVDARLSTAEWVAGIGWPAMLISTAAMSLAQFDALGGGRFSLRESAAEAVPQAAPLAVLLTVHGGLAAAGQRWSVMELVDWFLLPWLALAIPVCVLERRGVWESVRRCALLTEGRRARSTFILWLPVNFAQRAFERSERYWMNGLPAFGYYTLAAAVCAATLA